MAPAPRSAVCGCWNRPRFNRLLKWISFRRRFPHNRMRPIRVLLIAPSLDILGGQAVQATRLMAGIGKVDSVHMEFLPINPRLPGALAKLQKIKYIRTIATFINYFSQLLVKAVPQDVLHIFSAA